MLRRPPQLTTHFVALLLTAVLLALSYPLPGWSFLAWVALAPAGWLAATSRRPWTLVWTSTLVFAVWWAWMLRWLIPVTPPGAFAVAGFQSLFWVLALWATNVCVRRQRVPIAVALPLCWVSLEYVRSVWPWGGFAWFTLAQTQADWYPRETAPRLVDLVESGVPVLSFLIACSSGCIAEFVLLREKRYSRRGKFVMECWFAVISCNIVLALGNSHLTIPDKGWRPPYISVAVVQTNTPHDNKLSPTADTYNADFAALHGLHAKAVELAAPSGDKPALIVWPETVIPGPFNEPVASQVERWAMTLPNDADGQTMRARATQPRQARELVAEHGVPTMVGASTEQPRMDREQPARFNSATLLVPSGAETVYSKMHRVPFGEYIPLTEGLKRWVLATVSPYDFDYSIEPGEAVTVFEVPTGEAGPLRFASPICFEDTNAALCREMVYDPATGQKRVDALVNLTTNGWFGELPSDTSGGGLGWKSMRYQHLQLASLRAIENRVPVVRSVNTGVSAIIDSTGRIVAAAEPGEEAVLSANLVRDERRTVYAIVGDWPIMALAGATLGLVAWSIGRPPRLVIRRRRRLRTNAESRAASPA